MDIDNLANNYYQYLLKNGSKGRTPITYRRKIQMFVRYLKEELTVNAANCQNILQSLTAEQIKASINFYVKEGKIKYQSTADGYFHALTACYNYLLESEEYKIENKWFHKTESNNKLRQQYDELVVDLGLMTKEQTQPISEEECHALIRICDECIDNACEEYLLKRNKYGTKSYNSTYLNFVSAIAAKILLFVGSKNSVLINLKISDYDGNLNKIKINGFWVYLPDKLSMQMKKYIPVRAKIIYPEEKDDRLFVGFNRGNRGLTNASLFRTLKSAIGTQKAVAVAKYSILQMIDQGLQGELIKQFTGFSDEVYGACLEQIEENRGNGGLRRDNRILDSKLRTTPCF